MTAARLILCAMVFYNVGNADWRAAVTCAVIWAAVELGMVWTREYDRRERARRRREQTETRMVRNGGGWCGTAATRPGE